MSPQSAQAERAKRAVVAAAFRPASFHFERQPARLKAASAPVYKLDLAAGKRELVTTLAPSDPAGVTAVLNVRMTPDGKTYAYSYDLEISDLFIVENVR